MTQISFIGLGAMGRPMAGHLLTAGHTLTVWNRTASRAADLVSAGAHLAHTPAEAFRAPVIFSMLADDAAVRETLLNADVLSQAPAGAIHINLSTVSVELAREATRLHAEHGLTYLAAPVFGRVPVAEAGALNVLAAGPTFAIDAVEPLLSTFGTRTWRLGETPEQANLVKVLGNYLIASAIQSLGEVMSVGEGAGVEGADLVELLSSTIFPGPVYSAYGALMAARTYQPAGLSTELGRKDLRLALSAASAQGQQLPLGTVLESVFDQAIDAGYAGDDWASVAELRPRPQVGPTGDDRNR
ncbi:NAD(P)-dependent oxidoreductase [Mycetocola sp. JXN-3]|uniref:NAD(P)-dependent oxidoreductase n=1 Tax=Mycetocola sp. JXN-3 TaxID=2116510 RepID=UPI00165D134A|nr:NAD(P)-dependent oxidoreductase [Mycetocola sp. JXN-3]